MTKTDVSVLNHETGRLVSTVPVLSRSSARKPRLSPTAAVALPGTTVTDATGAGEPTTCTVSVSLSPPLVAVMVATPTAAYSVIVPPTPTDEGPETCTYAPPVLLPAAGSDTESLVVAPAETCTLGVTTASRAG